MTGSKKSGPPPLPKPPYELTKLPGGPKKIFDVIEHLRTRNHDGYLPGVGGMLAGLKFPPGLPIPPNCHGTTCSPFSATVIGVAFDPRFPIANDKDLTDDPYVPKFNGGKDELVPFYKFYGDHNYNDSAVKSLEKYGIGRELKGEEARRVRRGDLVEISWVPEPGKISGGHVVFVWDVHYGADGLVDCIQIVGSNGPTGGVTIHGCAGKGFLKGSNAVYKVEIKEKEVPDKKDPSKKIKKKYPVTTLVKKGDYEKDHEPLFKDSDAIVQNGHWYGLDGVAKGSIKTDTFVKAPLHPITYFNTVPYSFLKVKFGRWHYDDKPIESFATKGGSGAAFTPTTSPSSPAPAPTPAPKPAPATPPKPGHVPAPAIPVKAAEIKKDPEAPKKVEPKPAKQDKDKPVRWQYYVESALATFYKTKWIDADPGEPDDILDAKSKAALKKYQELFKLEVDGIVGPESLGSFYKQLPFCRQQAAAQLLLGELFKGKKIDKDPGPVDGINNPETKAAVEDFQKKFGIEPNGVPDKATFEKMLEVKKGHEPTAEKPGLAPEFKHLYWVGNTVEVGGLAKLRAHFRDLILGQECPVTLIHRESGKEVEAPVKLKVDKAESEVVITIPVEFGIGSTLDARITGNLAGDGELESTTAAPLTIRPVGGIKTDAADWRKYIDQPEVPAEILEIIKKNRAQFEMRKTITEVTQGKYAGKYHYNYKPGKQHIAWANEYVKKKVEAAATDQKKIPGAYVLMLDAEGLPASMQTYDSQIVTWGVGLGAKGNGVHAFTYLNKDAKMKKLLDDLGINYEKYYYRVVDLQKKKVISSVTSEHLGDDDRHIPPLKSWREQLDLLNAIIGISEDPATREPVIESQYSVYLSNSASWSGRDKVFTTALFFMVAHLHHWMPGIAKYGFNVAKIFADAGGGTPSLETDKKIAPKIAQAFVTRAKWHFITNQKDKEKYKDTYADIRDRTKSKVWARLKSDGKAEGFDPGSLTLEAD